MLASLPIDEHLPEICQQLREHGRLVLLAPPGAGKTTRVPPALLDAGIAREGTVVVLQPRRLAARGAASRIAEERGTTLGGEVGYRVRFESRCGPQTRIEIVTEGILIRRLQRDPFLEGVGVVVLDEFHERSLQSDLALALVEDLRRSGRDDLRLLVMSATLDPAPVARFLENAPIVETQGKMHPVDIVQSPQVLSAPLEEQMERSLREYWPDAAGHTLAFLPGRAEIRRTQKQLESFAARTNSVVVPLHGSLTLDEQQRALAPCEQRKIILTTNIAETSLTVEGVDLVIDSGWERLLRHAPQTGIDRLETVRISQHAAAQRAGRAGRVGPGRVVRLWTSAQQAALAPATEPEIRRVDLASTVLELRAWGVADPAQFGWYEAPARDALGRAEELLVDLGALTEMGGSLTEIGREMLALPVHPRLARLLVEARRSDCLADGCVCAALLEEREILRRAAHASEIESGPSDLLYRVDLFRTCAQGKFRRNAMPEDVDGGAVRAVDRVRRQLERLLAVGSANKSADTRAGSADVVSKDVEDKLLRSLLVAYPDRVARRREPQSDRGRLVGGRGVRIIRESVVREGEFFVALDVGDHRGGSAAGGSRGATQESLVRMASTVKRHWIEAQFPERIEERTRTYFDTETEKVRSRTARFYKDLAIEEERDRPVETSDAERLLATAAVSRAIELITAHEGANAWLERARFVTTHMSHGGEAQGDAANSRARSATGSAATGELAELISEAGLEGVVSSACAGKNSFRQLRQCDWLGLLKGSLPYAAQQLVDAAAPETIEVPSGCRIRLRYQGDKAPVLAVRLQELFGLEETPRVATGNVPVLLHILGPNYRPVQITDDLASFWTNTYAQVRKDLRGRYPKHSWPEDPRAATPERRPQRRRR